MELPTPKSWHENNSENDEGGHDRPPDDLRNSPPVENDLSLAWQHLGPWGMTNP